MTEEVPDFQTFARANQKKCYEIFGCSMFDSYDSPNGLELLRLKICFLFYGMPQEEGANSFENAYSDKQKAEAEKIVKKITNVIRKSGTSTISVGVIFVCGKSSDHVLSVPLFRIRISPHDDRVTTKFIDQNCRVYKNWNHWKETNHLPAGEYCYPKDGFYTCVDGRYAYDPDKEPILEFGKSSSSKPLSKFLRVCDTTLGPVMIVGAVAVAIGCGPFVAVGVGIVGTVGSVYGAIRAGQRLYDKATHEESLTDLESLSLWLTVISTPLCFVSSFANARLIVCAKAGNKFMECSRLLRYSVTILNATKIGLNAAGVVISLASLAKSFKNGKPSNLELLQLSLRVFFLCHTLMQPITAQNIYMKAQNQFLLDASKTFTDENAKTSFDEYLKNNDSIDAKAVVIRALNIIPDADTLFTEVGLDVKTMETCEHSVTVTYNNGTEKIISITPCTHDAIEKLICCIETSVIRPFREIINVNDTEKSLFENFFENENVRIFFMEKAELIAAELGIPTFFYLARLLVQFARSRNPDDLIRGFNDFEGCSSRNFFSQLQQNLQNVGRILATYSLNFLDQFMAIYYFRQLGANFPNIINSNIFHFYIDANLQDYITMDYYVATESLNDSSAFDLYLREQKFIIVVKRQQKQLLTIRFFKEGTSEEIAAQFKKIHNDQNYLSLNDAKVQICHSFGLNSVTILVSKEKQALPLELRNDLEDYYKSKIDWLLTALGTPN